MAVAHRWSKLEAARWSYTTCMTKLATNFWNNVLEADLKEVAVLPPQGSDPDGCVFGDFLDSLCAWGFHSRCDCNPRDDAMFLLAFELPQVKFALVVASVQFESLRRSGCSSCHA